MTNIYSWNCSVYQNKYKEIRNIIHDHQPFGLTLQEARLNPSDKAKLFAV